MRKVDLIILKKYENSPSIMDLRKQLGIEGDDYFVHSPKEAFEIGNRLVRDILIILKEKIDAFDLDYFFKECKKSSARAMTYQINQGQKLYFPLVGEMVLGPDYHDGFELEPIYYLDSTKKPYQQNVNNLIPLPKNGKSDMMNKKIPALFLDRDGVINEDTGYLHKCEDIKLMEEIVPIIKRANQKQIPVIVLTNQSGVARGMFQESDVDIINDKIRSELSLRGAKLDAIYTSYYFESGNIPTYQKKSLLRKPYPGMLLKAMEDFPIDIHRSFMLGDKLSDRLQMPGLRSITLKGNYPLEEMTNAFSSLKEIHTFLLQEFY